MDTVLLYYRLLPERLPHKYVRLWIMREVLVLQGCITAWLTGIIRNPVSKHPSPQNPTSRALVRLNTLSHKLPVDLEVPVNRIPAPRPMGDGLGGQVTRSTLWCFGLQALGLSMRRVGPGL